MDIGSILLILALAILTAIYISRPIMSQKEKNKPLLEKVSVHQQREHQRSALIAERERLLLALEELEADHALGKIPAEDFPLQRTVLLKNAADVLRQLDELQGQKPKADQEASQKSTNLEDDLEQLIAARRESLEEKTGGFCPHCGRPVKKSDKFCARCGATL